MSSSSVVAFAVAASALAGVHAAEAGTLPHFVLKRRVVDDAAVATAHTLRRLALRDGSGAFGPSDEHLAALRHRRLSDAQQDVVPIYGDFRSLAYYYADVFVGSMQQRESVIADTGSSLMAFPCASCGAACGPHMGDRYDPLLSRTSRRVPCGTSECFGSCDGSGHCTYSQSYAEGSSLRGEYYADSVFLGADDVAPEVQAVHAGLSIPFTFGCHTSETNMFTSQLADGIMGLGQDRKSFVRALWEQGKLESNVFSLCLSLDGGAMSIGRIASALHNTPIAWAAMSHSGFYSVQGLRMTSAGTDIGADFGSTILDSGTTFTYMPNSMVNALKRSITDYCEAGNGRCVGEVATPSSDGGNLCYNMAPENVHTFPGVTITLRGATDGQDVTIAMPPQYVWLNMIWQSGAHCLSIQPNHRSETVLGANFLMGLDVIFEMNAGNPGNARVGFAPSDCKVPAVGGPPSPTASASTTPSVTPSVTPSATPSVTGTASPTPALPSASAAPPAPADDGSHASSAPAVSPMVLVSPSSLAGMNVSTVKDVIGVVTGDSTLLNGVVIGVVVAVFAILACCCCLMFCAGQRSIKLGRLTIQFAAPVEPSATARERKINLQSYRRQGLGRRPYAQVVADASDDEATTSADAPVARAPAAKRGSPKPKDAPAAAPVLDATSGERADALSRLAAAMEAPSTPAKSAPAAAATAATTIDEVEDDEESQVVIKVKGKTVKV